MTIPIPIADTSTGIIHAAVVCVPANRTIVVSSGINSPPTSVSGGGTNKFTKIHSTVSPFMMLKFSVEPCGIPLIRQSDEIRFQFTGTVSVTEYDAACTGRGAVMVLIDVSGMFCAVESAGFVALNIVKSKEPSPFIVSLVILIVG